MEQQGLKQKLKVVFEANKCLMSCHPNLIPCHILHAKSQLRTAITCFYWLLED